jgi:inosine/xanthosine triphosphate pyrophosphatase family protein
LSEEVKNRLSHRAKALEKLRRWMLDAPPVNGSAL